jgi:hypothetical protein
VKGKFRDPCSIFQSCNSLVQPSVVYSNVTVGSLSATLATDAWHGINEPTKRFHTIMSHCHMYDLYVNITNAKRISNYSNCNNRTQKKHGCHPMFDEFT